MHQKHHNISGEGSRNQRNNIHTLFDDRPQCSDMASAFSDCNDSGENDKSITIKMDMFNELKAKLKSAEGLNIYLKIFKNMWREQAKRLKREINIALVNVECATNAPSNANTFSTLACKNSRRRDKLKITRPERDCVIRK